MTQQDQPVIRIGELLVRSGVITAYDLSEAEKLSSHMKVQFGRLLIMAGCLTEEALECALEAQGLIRDGLLNAEIACEALAFAVQENIPLRQSLEILDCLPQFGTSTLRLAELIHDANIIEEEKLQDAFDTSMETNRPLPEVLVEMHCISPGLLSIMLRMQEQIRNETLDREDAINELRGTFKIWKRADKAMANDPMSKSAIISAANATPVKPSRYTSSFDSVTRLPAMSPEILAGLNAQDAAAGKEASTSASAGAAQTQAPQAPQPMPASMQSPAAYGSQPMQAPAPPQQMVPQPIQRQQSPQIDGRSPSNPALPPSQVPASYGITGGAGGSVRAKGSDDLNVDRILQDYANNPPGQPMPDGVILYSQGYFPPDDKKPAEETFADGFSDEDEERINALLDVFASDVSSKPVSAAHHEPRATPEVLAADSWLIAADGWGVPDLAAAGANLTGAEMFAKAQADLSSSGWSFSQNNQGQSAPAARTQVDAPRDLPPPVPPPLMGQPLYVTPAPPHPLVQTQVPTSGPAAASAAAAAPIATPTAAPIADPAPIATPAAAPAAALITAATATPTPTPAAPAAPAATVPGVPTIPTASSSSSSAAAAAAAAGSPSAPPPALPHQESLVANSPAVKPGYVPEQPSVHWAAPPGFDAGSPAVSAPSGAPGPTIAKGLGHPDFRRKPEEVESDAASQHLAPKIVPANDEPSLFSPKLKETISVTLGSNPFKIRRVGTDSSPSVPMLPQPDSKAETKGDVAAKPDLHERKENSDEVVQAAENGHSEHHKPESSGNIEIEPESRSHASDHDQERSAEVEPATSESSAGAQAHESSDEHLDEANDSQEAANSASEPGPEARGDGEVGDAEAITGEQGGLQEAKSDEAKADEAKADEGKSDQGKSDEGKSDEETGSEKGPDENRTEENERKEYKPAAEKSDDPKPEAGSDHKEPAEIHSQGETDEHADEASNDKPTLKLNLSSKRKSVAERDDKHNSDLVSLLESAKFFTYDDLESAILKGLSDQTVAAELLGVLGIVDKSNLDAAIRLHKLLKAGSVETSKAISALDDLRTHKIRPAELTEQLGIKKPKRRK